MSKITTASQLWEQIKVLPLEIFALPNQTVSDYVKRDEGMAEVFPDDIYVTLRVGSVFPALEETLSNAVAKGAIKLAKHEKFDISQSARHTVIKVVAK